MTPIAYWTTRGYANSRTGQLADVAGIKAIAIDKEKLPQPMSHF